MAVGKQGRSRSWPVTEAKAHFDEVIDEVEGTGPQQLVRNGDPLAVVAASDDWDDEPIQDLVTFLGSARLEAGELIIPPRTGTARDLEW